jgi:predicted secreted Zn-dependent protease
MRNLVILVGLVFAASAVVAQAPVSPSPRVANPICAWAFSQAVAQLESAEAATAAPVQATAVPGASVAPDPGPDAGYLDDAIRMCAGLDDFHAGLAQFPEALMDTDVMAFLLERCGDPEAGLEDTMTCWSLVQALATPVPTLAPSPSPSPSPQASPEPVVQMTRVPDIRAHVPGATRVRYMNVRGADPRQLTRSVKRAVASRCKSHAALACTRWRLSAIPTVSQDVVSGRCVVTGVRVPQTSVAYIPRWTAPRQVSQATAWWWRKVVRRIGRHEAQRIRVLQAHIERLSDRVVGLPCSDFERVQRRWVRSVEREQRAFDRHEARRQARQSARWWTQAVSRFGG